MSCCDVCGFIRTLFSKSGATRQMLLPLIKKDASAKQSQQYQVAQSIAACRPWNNNLESVEFDATWSSQSSFDLMVFENHLKSFLDGFAIFLTAG